MEKLKEYRYIIFLGLIILGGFYYTSQLNKPKLVDTQQKDKVSIQNLKEESDLEAFSVFENTFKCSVWAEIADEAKEAERLFLFGYKQGKEIINTLKKQEDFLEDSAYIYSNEDFFLGVMYSSIANDAVKSTRIDGNASTPYEMQKFLAKDKFRESNCQWIGK